MGIKRIINTQKTIKSGKQGKTQKPLNIGKVKK